MYICLLGDFLGGSTVIGVRIPRRLKEELEKLGIDYAKEIKCFLEKRVREEKAKRLIREINEFMGKIKPIGENLSARMIREDRDKG